MLSIIIPTMQKNNVILNLLLDELVCCDCIDEIVLIDNSCNGYNYNSEKIKLIIPENNLYVNSSWNLGVKVSKNEYIGILNDDIIFPKNFFEQVFEFLKNNQNIGIIGLDTIVKTPESKFNSYPENSNVYFSQTDIRENCFGSAMFMKKENYFNIPENLRIWFGDDYLFEKNIEKGFRNYKIINADIKHIHSNTCKSEEFSEIIKKDIENYYKDNSYLENNYTLLYQKYDLIVPVGAACSCTDTLRKKDLQVFSYPFDWLYGSDFLNRIKILVSDFENWLNIEDLKFAGTREYPLPCDIYLNTRTNIVFNHDFPLNNPLSLSFPKVKEKYSRRINRLLYQISNSKNVLFVYLERPDIRKDILTEELKESYELLKNRFPNVDINILYLFNAREVDYENRKIINVSNHIIRADFDYDLYNDEHPYIVNNNPILNIFNHITISNKFLNFKQKCKKLIKFIPNIIVKCEKNENFTRVILFNLIRFKIWK